MLGLNAERDYTRTSSVAGVVIRVLHQGLSFWPGLPQMMVIFTHFRTIKTPTNVDQVPSPGLDEHGV